MPTLPQSFATDGFLTPELARRGGKKFRRLMIRAEGPADSGKTEFLMTCPGPGEVLAVDRGFDAVFDNPHPPTTRRQDFGFKPIQAPSATDFSDAAGYRPYWIEFYRSLIAGLTNTESRTVAIDGDNVSWDLQRLAEHGKLTGIFPATRYTDVYAARRALYYKCWDSGKIIVATNMMRDEYVDMLDKDGNVMLDDKGEVKRMRSGGKVSAGFPDYDYLWQICIRHLMKPATPPKWNPILKKNLGAKGPEWGIEVVRSKAKPELNHAHEQLWGDDCTFTGLVSLIYPHISLAEWGL